MPTLMMNAPAIADKQMKPTFNPAVPLAKGGISQLVLPPKPNMVKMP